MALLLLAAALTPPVAADGSCEDPRRLSRELQPGPLAAGHIGIEADQVDLRASGRSRLHGGVRIQRERDVFVADDVTYDNDARLVTTPERTRFESDSIGVTARAARIRFETESAVFTDAEFVLFESGARGHAGRIAVRGESRAELNDVRYTTCPGDNPDWVLIGGRFKLDSERGLGSARNVRLNFKGVPLFWLPAFWFPVGDARRTGLLAPEIGDGGTTGLDFKLPLYINLAPNYDLLLIPRQLATRGTQLGSRLRWLWRHGQGRAEYEHLGRDEDFDRRTRSRVGLRYRGGSGRALDWEAEYNRVSDIDYFTDLGASQTDAARTQLPRRLRLSARTSGGFEAHLRASEYQALTETATVDEEPYSRLPDVTLGWQPRYRNRRLRPQLRVNAVKFVRDGTTEGWRNDVLTGLDWRWDGAAGFLAAGADFRHTEYDLSDAAGEPQTHSRSVPGAVAEAGLRFLRPAGGALVQTLEPRLHYLYVPYRDQSALPVFDTSLPDFAFDQLFARNRFTGLDRIADANLVTLAIDSRLINAERGTRPAGFRFGLQWRLEESRVTLPDTQVQDAGSSDWLGELDFRLPGGLRGVVGGQLNTDTNRISQSVFATRYEPRSDAMVQTAYRFRRGIFEQGDLTVAWPVSPRWRLAGRWTYAFDARRTVDALGGLEYKSCCWSARIAWRRYLNGDADEFNSSVYIQLELSGLAKLGDGIDGLLDRDILPP